ncbi:MAG: hypothetical protein F4008_02200 [Gammaproteobacteria bacterium]|nr:hypothetical protein [Gammaproteobacteria bacterium]MYL12545.1 hypothetical protein [Gammaproteobacteria bacterium]
MSVNRILAHVLGLPVLIVSISAAGQSADPEAKQLHYLPMMVNGDGYQSTLLVTNVAEQSNRCSLRLLPNGLSANSFEVHELLSWNGSAAAFTLPNSGSRLSIVGRILPTPEVYGSATLDCDMPAAARVLLTLRSENEVAAAALLPSAQIGAAFKFPVLPRFGGYLLAIYNEQGSAANCRFELADESGAVIDEQLLSIAADASVFRDISELARMPADFGGGSAKLSCDGQVAATGLLAGAAMSGLPPAVLSRLPETPQSPANIQYVRDGSTTVLSWDAVEGADYYKIYHDDFSSSRCRLNSSGSASFCDEIAANVTGTSYIHASPNDDANYYWVVACNAGGCSDIDGDNPAELGAGGDNEADDHGDNRASATRIAAGDDIQGALTAGDTDYFRLDVNSSGSLEAYTSGGLDSIGRLEDSSGALLDSDDDGGDGLNFKLQANVDSGAYYVRVTGYGDSQDGDYTLHTRFTPGTGGNDGGGDSGACRAGLVVNPGESCAYNGFDFTVSSSGRGSIAFFSAGTAIDARGSTINGVRWNFYATKNSGSNSWTVHVAD